MSQSHGREQRLSMQMVRQVPKETARRLPSEETLVKKRYNHCVVERRMAMIYSNFSLLTGKTKVKERKTVVKPCETPLFSDREELSSVCRSCASGWKVKGNSPTTRGLKQ